MEQVCHTCPWWQEVQGKHPQSREDIHRWDCAIAWFPLLLIENSHRQMQTAASVDKVANEMQKTDQQSSATIAMLTTLLNRAVDTPRAPQITNGHGEPPLMLGRD